MNIQHKNTAPRYQRDSITSFLLVSRRTGGAENLAITIVEMEPSGSQNLHSHKPEQMYYILEGSGHRDGNNVRLFVQLLDGKKDRHIWSQSFDADIKEIFAMQSEIAQMIASEIQAFITPEEKELIEKIPTTDLTAYDYYQQGREEQWKFSSRISKSDPSILEKAENMYRQAIHYDSSFAKAYAGLAETFIEKFTLSGYLAVPYLDSALLLA